MECIYEALDDSDSLRLGLWWYTRDINDLHPHVRHAIEEHPRAYYLEPFKDENERNRRPDDWHVHNNAELMMEVLCGELGINRARIQTRIDKNMAEIRERSDEFERRSAEAGEFLKLVESAVRGGSQIEPAKYCIGLWESKIENKIDHADPCIAAKIKRFVAMLMLHYTSVMKKIGPSEQGIDYSNDGERLIEEAKQYHGEDGACGDKYELAMDHVHYGAYLSKQNKLEGHKIEKSKQDKIFRKAEEELIKSLELFEQPDDQLRARIWLARLEYYRGHVDEGIKALDKIIEESTELNETHIADFARSWRKRMENARDRGKNAPKTND